VLHVRNCVRVLEYFVGVERGGSHFLDGTRKLEPLLAGGCVEYGGILAHNNCLTEMLPGMEVAHDICSYALGANSRLLPKFKITFCHYHTLT
jgi:hypothetical protein